MSSELKEKIKNHHLFQVFIDGRIKYEVYISQLKAEGVMIKAAQRTGKYEVLVKIS
jgi:archaellum component FlaG (FlaF/FlaG flagellin family)